MTDLASLRLAYGAAHNVVFARLYGHRVKLKRKVKAFRNILPRGRAYHKLCAMEDKKAMDLFFDALDRFK